MSASVASPCPRCGAPASGQFCAACGAPLGDHPCASCGTILSAGTKFCHKCGTPAGAIARGAGVSNAPSVPVAAGHGSGAAAPLARTGPKVPWIIAGLLAIVAITAVVYAGSRRGDVPVAAAAASPGNPVAGGTPAPDISQMTPREQFDRIIERVTTAAARGDSNTVERFWTMALGAYQNLPAADRNADAQFDMAWLHLFAAQYPQAKALADTIMAAVPNHLLGYYLRATVAKAQGDSVGAREAGKAFRAHYDAEMANKNRPEYGLHRALLEKFRDSVKTP